MIQYIYAALRPRPRRHRRDRDLLSRALGACARSARRSASRRTSTAALATTIWGLSNGAARGACPPGRARSRQPAARARLELTQELIGFPRHLSQHVGGFVLTRGRLDETVPIGNAAMEDRTFIEWDKDDLDALGLLKVDVLALGMLTCIRKALRPAAASTAGDLDLAHRAARGPRRLRHAAARRIRSACSRSRAGRR